MQSANWASKKILEQSQAYMEKHEATQNPVKISPGVAKRVKMARKYEIHFILHPTTYSDLSHEEGILQ